MDFDETTYDFIDKYLNGELSGEELRAFEARKNSDAALAQEIELSASMKAFLSDNVENDLRKNLQELGEGFSVETEEVKKKIGLWTWIQETFDQTFSVFAPPVRYALYLLPFLLALGLWWVFSNNQPREPPIVNNPPIDTFKTTPHSTPPQKEKEIVKEQKEPKEVIQEPTPETPKEDEKKSIQEDIKPTPQQPTLIAADFTPNPSLDFLIGNNLRNDEIQLEVQEKMKNINITPTKIEATVAFQLKGAFTSKENLSEKDLKVYIFSNKKSAYEDFLPFTTIDVNINEDGANIYSFLIQKNILLKRGLYYYLLEDASTEQTFFVEKFEVK